MKVAKVEQLNCHPNYPGSEQIQIVRFVPSRTCGYVTAVLDAVLDSSVSSLSLLLANVLTEQHCRDHNCMSDHMLLQDGIGHMGN